jgi:hypothetical protein
LVSICGNKGAHAGGDCRLFEGKDANVVGNILVEKMAADAEHLEATDMDAKRGIENST